METQNISAQLFNQQLPLAQEAIFTGCKNDMDTNFLTTCVDYAQSDKNIENAFQEQLNLSEYYKSKQVFGKMKEIFNTNERNFDTDDNVKLAEKTPNQPEPVNIKPILPVGPRDTLLKSLPMTKETFGKKNNNGCSWPVILLIIFAIIAVLILLIKK
jgi:hypothetical protein